MTSPQSRWRGQVGLVSLVKAVFRSRRPIYLPSTTSRFFVDLQGSPDQLEKELRSSSGEGSEVHSIETDRLACVILNSVHHYASRMKSRRCSRTISSRSSSSRVYIPMPPALTRVRLFDLTGGERDAPAFRSRTLGRGGLEPDTEEAIYERKASCFRTNAGARPFQCRGTQETNDSPVLRAKIV